VATSSCSPKTLRFIIRQCGTLERPQPPCGLVLIFIVILGLLLAKTSFGGSLRRTQLRRERRSRAAWPVSGSTKFACITFALSGLAAGYSAASSTRRDYSALSPPSGGPT